MRRVERTRLAALEPDVDVAAVKDTVEAMLPYKCEHVVPQSWFAKAEPMRRDLHHLFACESRCNKFPFFMAKDRRQSWSRTPSRP